MKQDDLFDGTHVPLPLPQSTGVASFDLRARDEPPPPITEAESTAAWVALGNPEVVPDQAPPTPPQPTGLDAQLYGTDLFGDPAIVSKQAPLAKRFLIPPFSVFDAAGGFWQERKQAWMGLGIRSEVGRQENLLGSSATAQAASRRRPSGSAFGAHIGKWLEQQDGRHRGGVRAGAGEDDGEDNGTSVFDPVLCELMYRWFVPAGGSVLDPFAGGSVRGIVAAKLGLHYYGVELREVQVAANREQAAAICGPGEPAPVWVHGDSAQVLGAAPQQGLPGAYDFVFTCPPYGDLEVYSDDPADLSNMDYRAFIEALTGIVAHCAARLRPNRYAAIVVGDFRDKKTGAYRNFVGETISAFLAAGLSLYNEAILVTVRGSLPIRAGKQFAAGRKLGKTHQNVLVFCKGDGMAAARACPQL